MIEGEAMEHKLSHLAAIELFANISETKLHAMLRCLGSRRKSYAKNQTIVATEDPIQEVGILLSGAAQIIREDFLGNRTIVNQIDAGHTFAETFVCAGEKKSPVTVIAVAESEVLYIQFKRLIATCSSACEFHGRLIENMLKIIAGKNIMMNQKIELLSQRSIDEKLKQYFIHQMNLVNGRRFAIPFSRSQLADYLCVDRSALSRELGKLKKQGKIRFHKNDFEIVDL